MKMESRLVLAIALFFAIVTPIYWFVSYEIIGTVALLLTTLTLGMIGGYVGLVGRKLDLRYEDNKQGEIVDGAGPLGFFPPSSIWPFWCAVVLVLVTLGPVFGWWLTILGVGLGIWAVCGWCYEYYLGRFQH